MFNMNHPLHSHLVFRIPQQCSEILSLQKKGDRKCFCHAEGGGARKVKANSADSHQPIPVRPLNGDQILNMFDTDSRPT